ncbi:MAG: protein kinase domain-containing protein, partial [Planctomycetota bacterium]
MAGYGHPSRIVDAAWKRNRRHQGAADEELRVSMRSFQLRIDQRGEVLLYDRALLTFLGCEAETMSGKAPDCLHQLGWPLLADAISEAQQHPKQALRLYEHGHLLRLLARQDGDDWDLHFSLADDSAMLTRLHRSCPAGSALSPSDLAVFFEQSQRDISLLVLVAHSCGRDFLQDQAVYEQVQSICQRLSGHVIAWGPRQILCLFGAPDTLSDHALRAAQAALLLQTGLPPQAMPACGLATGNATVGCIGTDDRIRYHASGEPLLIGLHLAGIAAPGELLCCESVAAEAMAHLPSDWQQSVVQGEAIPLDAFPHANGLQALPDQIAGRLLQLQTEDQELRLRWLFQLQVPDLDPVTVVAIEGQVAVAPSVAVDLRTRRHSERRIGRYRVQYRLGRGGMGEVHLALDPHGRRIALKTLLAAEYADDRQLRRFRQEAQALARLQHPNICPLEEIGEVDGLIYLAMPFIDGVSLADVLDHGDGSAGDLCELADRVRQARSESSAADQDDSSATWDTSTDASGNRLPVQQALAIILACADAIQHAHERGILHRDLKPQNIMLDRDGQVMVLDFGLAKMRDADQVKSLSRSDVLMGTIGYMAPEQAISTRDLDERTDVYALGAILYELLSGRPHFLPSGNLVLDAGSLQSHRPQPLTRLVAGLDADLWAIVATALARRRQHRYAGMLAFATDLRRYRDGSTISARPPNRLSQLADWAARNPSRTLALGLAAGLLVGSTLIYSWMLNTQIQAAEEARDQAQHHLQQLHAESAALAVAEADRRELESHLHGQWDEILVEDFRDPEAVSRRWEMFPRDRVWQLTADGLRVEAGTLAALTYRHPLPGDVRIEFQATIEGENLDDLGCFLNARGPTPRDLHDRAMPLQHAYAFQVGAFGNTRNRINRLGDVLTSRSDSALRSGQRYHVIAERRGDTLTLTLNGRSLLQVVDPRPLDDAAHCLAGVSTWFAGVTWHEIRISRLGLAPRIDPVQLARDLVQQDRLDLAEELYRYALGSIHTEAAERGLARIRHQRQLTTQLPTWRARLQERWPEARITIQQLGEQILLDVTADRPLSLTALRGIPVSRLSCGGCQLEELDILAELPLHSLQLRNCDLVDITALASLRLHELRLSGNAISDLSPLRGMELDTLSITDNRVTDLEPLRGMPLRRLWCNGNIIDDISPLQGMPLLFLHCRDNQLTSLEPLRDMPLQQLDCSGNDVSDLTPLAGMPLDHLSCNDNLLRSLEPLRSMPLAILECRHNRIHSLRGLEDSPLSRLHADGNLIEDLTPLAQLQLAV